MTQVYSAVGVAFVLLVAGVSIMKVFGSLDGASPLVALVYGFNLAAFGLIIGASIRWGIK